MRMSSSGARLASYMCLLASLAACTVPTERSASLVVEVGQIPDLIRNDTVTLSARLLDGEVEVPNAIIRFSSYDAGILNVSEDGHVLAVGAGDATINATAVQFLDAQHAVVDVHVRNLFELDSIGPQVVRYGEPLYLYGVGLDPERLIAATLGGVNAIGHSYAPEDPAEPARFGTLALWATPPAPLQSTAALLGLDGLLMSEPVTIVQRDLYEPNDSGPAHLGTLDSEFRNPALAFERIRRGDHRLGVDWYTFTTQSAGAVTIAVWAPTGGSTFDVFVADALVWSPVAFNSLGYGVYAVGGAGWAVGRGFRPCEGLGLKYRNSGEFGYTFEVPPDSAVFALADLPAGTYNVFVRYADGGPFYDEPSGLAGVAVFVDSLNLVAPLRYGMQIQQGYRSRLPPDRFEENDFCNPDTRIAVPDTVSGLTIDTPHDADWYRFSIEGAGKTVRFSLDVADSLADLDTYVVADYRPDSLVVVEYQFGADVAQQATGRLLDVGDYFLVVVDFLGVPTEYALRSEVVSAVPTPHSAAVLPSGFRQNQSSEPENHDTAARSTRRDR